MGNMSYCMFRNTTNDFQQCLDKIGEMQTLNELRAGESGAARDLRELAEQYIEWFDQIDEDINADSEDDSEDPNN